MTEEKTYTQKEVDNIINNVRIDERFMANQLMGNLGIPAERRLSPDGKLIYKEAADIIMNILHTPPKKPDESPEE